MVGEVGAAGGGKADNSADPLSSRAAQLHLSFVIQQPDDCRRTVTGDDLTRYLANGELVRTELGLDPQDFQALVARACERGVDGLSVRVDRNRGTRTLRDGVDGNATEQINQLVSDGRALVLRVPESGARIGTTVVSSSSLIIHHSSLVFEGNPNDRMARVRARAQLFLLSAGPELRAQIAPPVARADAERVLRDMLLRQDRNHHFRPDQIDRFAKLVYDESLALWPAPAETTSTSAATSVPALSDAERRQQIVAAFINAIPEGSAVALDAATILNNPLLDGATPDRLEARLNAIAARGFKRADLEALRGDLRATREALSIADVDTETAAVPRTEVRLDRESTLVINGGVAGGETREFVVDVYRTVTGPTRGRVLELSTNDTTLHAYMQHAPKDRRARQMFAEAVAAGASVANFAELAKRCNALAGADVAADAPWLSFLLNAEVPAPRKFTDLVQLAASVSRAERQARERLERELGAASAEPQRQLARDAFEFALKTERARLRDAVTPGSSL